MTFSEVKPDEVIIKLYNPILQFEEVKKIWINLLAKCPHNFYLSWGWKEVWLKNLPKDCNLSLLVGFKNKIPIFAFFIGSRKEYRYGVLNTHQISLNSTTIKFLDKLSIEYNAILMDPEITLSLGTLIQLMPITNWDEFHFRSIALNYFPNFEFKINLHDKYIIQKKDLFSYYVDLKIVRDADMNYMSLLSSRRRKRLREYLKAYKKEGKILTIAANTKDEALSMYEELKKFHQKTWVKRGDPGAFSNEYFDEFHRNLIASRFNKNEIQLLHIKCGQDTIGYLYNFIFNGQVLGYQCGFNYPSRKVFSPGMICIYFAVLYNAEIGLDYYNFGEGEAYYKKTLSTDCAEMQNILVQKKNIKFAIENKLKKIFHSIRKLKDQF